MNNQLSLAEILAYLYSKRKVLFVFIVIGAVAGFGAAIILKPQYAAEVLLMSKTGSSSDLGGLAGQLGGLTALAGISLGSSGDSSEEYLQSLKSRAFTRSFIERHELMPIIYSGDWDAEASDWRDPDDAPTLNEAVQDFRTKVLSVDEDSRTGTITLSIVWFDRELASRWANDYVADADQALRMRALEESERSMEYLKTEAANTNIVELRQTIYGLMESQLKNATLARSSEEFAFRVIDPATVSDDGDAVKPRRLLLIAGGLLFGLALGIISSVLMTIVSSARQLG